MVDSEENDDEIMNKVKVFSSDDSKIYPSLLPQNISKQSLNNNSINNNSTPQL